VEGKDKTKSDVHARRETKSFCSDKLHCVEVVEFRGMMFVFFVHC
jgi:hypothetical protein